MHHDAERGSKAPACRIFTGSCAGARTLLWRATPSMYTASPSWRRRRSTRRFQLICEALLAAAGADVASEHDEEVQKDFPGWVGSSGRAADRLLSLASPGTVLFLESRTLQMFDHTSECRLRQTRPGSKAERLAGGAGGANEVAPPAGAGLVKTRCAFSRGTLPWRMAASRHVTEHEVEGTGGGARG